MFEPGSAELSAAVVEVELDLLAPIVLSSAIVSTKYFKMNLVTACTTTTVIKYHKIDLLECNQTSHMCSNMIVYSDAVATICLSHNKI